VTLYALLPYHIAHQLVLGMPREKDVEQQILIDMGITDYSIPQGPVKLLDIGSCQNPFNNLQGFEVTALDLCPGQPSVYQVSYNLTLSVLHCSVRYT
jgi:hypothetical protein